MKFEEYKTLNLVEYINELTSAGKIPTQLHTYQGTKIGMDGFSGLSIHSCPGRSKLCENSCYDAKSVKVLVGGKKILMKAAFYTYWAMYDPDRLEDQLTREVPICSSTVRVHVGGDFINPKHVEVWKKVARRNPKTTFYAYTRSWRIPQIEEELRRLNELNNFSILASIDSETGVPVKLPYKLAQLTPFVKIENSIICPEQTGVVSSCEKCRLCFNKKVDKNIIFLLHGSGRKMSIEKVI